MTLLNLSKACLSANTYPLHWQRRMRFRITTSKCKAFYSIRTSLSIIIEIEKVRSSNLMWYPRKRKARWFVNLKKLPQIFHVIRNSFKMLGLSICIKQELQRQTLQPAWNKIRHTWVHIRKISPFSDPVCACGLQDILDTADEAPMFHVRATAFI